MIQRIDYLHPVVDRWLELDCKQIELAGKCTIAVASKTSMIETAAIIFITQDISRNNNAN